MDLEGKPRPLGPLFNWESVVVKGNRSLFVGVKKEK